MSKFGGAAESSKTAESARRGDHPCGAGQSGFWRGPLGPLGSSSSVARSPFLIPALEPCFKAGIRAGIFPRKCFKAGIFPRKCWHFFGPKKSLAPFSGGVSDVESFFSCCMVALAEGAGSYERGDPVPDTPWGGLFLMSEVTLSQIRLLSRPSCYKGTSLNKRFT